MSTSEPQLHLPLDPGCAGPMHANSALENSYRSMHAAVQKQPGVGDHIHLLLLCRVVVAGFSQGGAVALLMLRSDLKLAGVAGLSTWLTLANEPLLSAANQATPLWMAHGTADAVVRVCSLQSGLSKDCCHTEHGNPSDIPRGHFAGCRSQVRYEYGERSAAKLKAAGAQVVFNSYPGMQHEAAPEELTAFQQWLTSVLG